MMIRQLLKGDDLERLKAFKELDYDVEVISKHIFDIMVSGELLSIDSGEWGLNWDVDYWIFDWGVHLCFYFIEYIGGGSDSEYNSLDWVLCSTFSNDVFYEDKDMANDCMKVRNPRSIECIESDLLRVIKHFVNRVIQMYCDESKL